MPISCQADAPIKQMPTCPVNLFPLSFYSHVAEGNTACPQLTIMRNADSTTEVRLLEYLRFDGTSHTRKGPHQRASTSDRLWQWFSSCLFRLSCCLSSAATPDRMWGPWVFSVQPLRAAPWLSRPCKGFVIGGGGPLLNRTLSLFRIAERLPCSDSSVGGGSRNRLPCECWPLHGLSLMHCHPRAAVWREPVAEQIKMVQRWGGGGVGGGHEHKHQTKIGLLALMVGMYE